MQVHYISIQPSNNPDIVLVDIRVKQFRQFKTNVISVLRSNKMGHLADILVNKGEVDEMLTEEQFGRLLQISGDQPN